jgi:uncharacterized membrane protein
MAVRSDGREGGRIPSLDALRGLMMTLMALDHARFFVARIHPLEVWNAPLPQYRDIASFFTRLSSHLCAPGFFFLMGVGMALFAESRRRQGWSEGRIARHFILRGLLVLFLQLFVVNPAWFLGTMGSTATLGNAGSGGAVWFNLDVLYGLGACMAILSLLLRANGALVAATSLGAIGAAQVLLPAPEHAAVAYSPLARMMMVPGQTGCLLVLYPILPWVGIAGLGLAFGKWVARDCAGAFRWLPVAGVVSLVFFVVVRALGGFGNFHAPDGGSWVAFLNTTKYPPSLTFTLFTLGVDLLLLALFSKFDPRLAQRNPLMVFGRTALFFYLVHLYLYTLGRFVFAEGGSLGVVYGVWLVGLVVLYPLCQWYGGFKVGTAPDGIWRFF